MVASFDFDNFTVKVKAAYSKRKREDILPLRKDTADAVRELLKSKTPNTKAFNLPSKYRMADMIREDFKDAGIDWQDDGDGVLDFHSLRHSTASLLAASGVHPKTAQDLMRHSDINLTMSRYIHTLRGQAQKAIKSMPDLSLHSSQTQKAIGTDDKPIDGAYKKLTKNSDIFRNWNVSDVTNWQSGHGKNSLNSDVSRSLKAKTIRHKKSADVTN